MLMSKVMLAVIGLCGGLLVSGGVFTVLVSVGLIPRFAGKTHTGSKIFLYEEMVVAGTLSGNIISIFDRFVAPGKWVRTHEIFGRGTTEQIWLVIGIVILLIIGLFAGIFVGCLALAIAEMLDSIPIFARRIGFRHGLGFAVLAIALGKLIGSLIYFTQSFYLYGG